MSGRELRGAVLIAAFVVVSSVVAGVAWAAEPVQLATIGPRTVKGVNHVIIKGFAGTIFVERHLRKDVDVTIVGERSELVKLRITNAKKQLIIERKTPIGYDEMFHGWFDWMEPVEKKLEELPTLTLLVPEGLSVHMHDVLARATVDDINAHVSVSAHYLEGSFGNLSEADVELLGAGDVVFGDVKGTFDLGIYGDGKVRLGSAGPTKVKIAGSGDVRAGEINGPLSVSVSGSGDVRTYSVNGATSLAVDGKGDIRIDRGRAAPFKLSINGRGSVRFKGLAVNPAIKVHGRGNVTLGLYEGKLNTSGIDEVKVIGKAEE